MKRNIALILSLALIILAFAGCGAGTTATSSGTATETSAAATSAAATSAAATSAAATSAAPEATAPAASGDAVKTGLAIISSIAKSTDAADKDGLAEVDSTIAAVMVDKDGKIVSCKIDAAQTKVNFSKAGQLTTPTDSAIKSKQELGADYGLGKASAIKKEWNEQADAFAQYCIGKTADEVKGIAVNDQGTAANTDLSSSVTIHIGDFMNVVQKAVANAKDVGAISGDKLGLGVKTSISGSTNAGDKDGLAQAYSYYTATTFSADGKITSCVIDASQSNVNFSKEGKVTSDLKAELKTKQELGPDYGLAKASSIKKEWNEQADAFAKYVTGKTVDEVKGIAVTEKGTPSGTDLNTSVTVHIADFETVIEKASANAK